MEEIKQAHAWNISSFLSSSALSQSLHPAVVDKGRRTSYQELEVEVNSLANALSSLQRNCPDSGTNNKLFLVVSHI